MKADVNHVRALLEDSAIEWDIADLALIELLARNRREREQSALLHHWQSIEHQRQGRRCG